MKTLTKIILLSAFIFGIPHYLSAKILIVTHKDSAIEPLQKEIVQYIFLGKIDTLKGVRITPLYQNDPLLHGNFCTYVLGKNQSQYASYWARLVFTGKKSIPKQYTTQEIIELLQKPNTITYIDEKNFTNDWKILYESY